MATPSGRGLLAKVGFLLCREGLLPEAEAVFRGLDATAPGKDGPAAGLALCRIIRGECDEAVSLLDGRLAAGSPLAASLSLYKLVALGMGGRLAETRELRARMAAEGMGASLETADALLAELARIRS